MAQRALLSSQRIFLTGANSRLAACIRPDLTAQGFEIVPISRREGLELRFALPDLAGTAFLHLAWSTLPATAEQVPNAGETDLAALEKILASLAQTPPKSRPQFIFFSSGGAVYGPRSGPPSCESDDCRPIGNYGRAKLAAENLIRQNAERFDLPVTILRITNPYGFPISNSRAQGIIPHALASALSGRPLHLWGDGSAQKDFLHYTDFNRALQTIIEQRLLGTYNLGFGQSHCIRDVLTEVEKVTGHPIAVIPSATRPWDVQDCALNVSKLQTASGWSPAVSLEEGLKLTARALPH